MDDATRDPSDESPPAPQKLQFGHTTANGRQCRAKSKRSGVQCRNLALDGRELCRMHGGKNKRGADHPHFKHGRYCAIMPENLLKRYRIAREDADRLVLEDEIALVDARTSQLVERCESGENGERWQSLGRALDAFKLAYQKGDAKGMSAALRQIDREVESGQADHANWQEILQCITQRQRLVESERKRLVELQQTLTIEQAMTFITALMESVRRHVADPPILIAIATDLDRLLGGTVFDRGPSLPPSAGG